MRNEKSVVLMEESDAGSCAGRGGAQTEARTDARPSEHKKRPSLTERMFREKVYRKNIFFENVPKNL